ncbi:MAG: energy transducer TonB [Betaproteobacteria bacterium]|nr:energy transducer TonB [Betaproteobacteria bacterium]
MTAALFPHPVESRLGPARRRSAAAFALSALLHLSLAGSLVVDATPSGRAPPAVVASLHVRLEGVPPPPVPEPAPLPVVSRPSRAAAVTRSIGPAKDEANPGDAAVSIALRELPDPVYYPARELDSYPRPVAPLDFGRPAGIASDGMPGKAQLMLQINEHGTVDRVSIVELEPRGRFGDELRAALLRTQFLPALRGGRPVKSRILLSISFPVTGESSVQP